MPAQASAAVNPSLTLKRRLNAPAEKVYAAWTDPKQLVRWFGPDAGAVTHAETDLRVGGKYVVIFFTEDGEEHYVSGTYQDVVPNEKLVFSWAWRSTPERESLVTVTIKPDGDGVILTLLHERFFDQAARDRHEFGWTGSMNKLEALFA
jgi:uncharacterized protein YndB with AHSA1/START domain